MSKSKNLVGDKFCLPKKRFCKGLDPSACAWFVGWFMKVGRKFEVNFQYTNLFWPLTPPSPPLGGRVSATPSNGLHGRHMGTQSGKHKLMPV